MLQKFKKHIGLRFPALSKAPFLLACSGGLDSVVLAELCASCDLDFGIAHCNFNLRGTASDEDEKFVMKLAKKLRKEYYVKHFETVDYVRNNKVSVQMAARELRYNWFDELMLEYGYGFLVTGHQADDKLETFIINLSRGTGIDGLSGIPEDTPTIKRPLLQFSRADILAYAKENKIVWREDTSNADKKYLRNRIRHELVPGLKSLHPTFDKNFAKTLEYLAGTSSLVDNHIRAIRKKLFNDAGDHYSISVRALKLLQPLRPYLYELFKEYGFTEWEDVMGLLDASSGKEVRSASYRLIKNREVLLLQSIKTSVGVDKLYYLDDKPTSIPIKLQQSTVNKITDTAQTILYIDKETLNHRLSVRKWKNGDYFYPLGMDGKKKISKYFKDEKMSLISKEAQWLLCSGEDIVWVIGKRADDRFKVTNNTKSILKIRWVV